MEKRYDPQVAEKAMQDFWARHQIYRFDPGADGEIYSIDTPPPTVSGDPHIGHIFSYTQAEIIARFRRMLGMNVFYPFGFDDNGLPTERLVERETGIRAADLPRDEFISRCVDTTRKYEAQFRELWDSLGFSCDWALQYETVSPAVAAISQRSFIELARAGKSYAKESPVLWCTECRTSIAQAELDTADAETEFVYLPFEAGGQSITIATTRPELLCACVCLFVHPEDERYAGFAGKTATVPLYGFGVPVIADEDADRDKGSGAVMCCTFGDAADAKWAEKYGLPYKKAILPDGGMDESVHYIGGMPVKQARAEIIRLLNGRGLILKRETLTHAVGAHERCGTEVEILPSRQWYIDILSDQQRFLDAADEINWYPAHMKARYTAWVSNLKWDWCISRQRYFGVPIPVWYCAKCGKPHFADIEKLPVNPLETRYTGVCDCGCPEFTPEASVMDTWATSSLTPQINQSIGYQGRDGFMPMSMRTQAHEIIRTWTFYTIVKSLYHTGEIPWRDIMICGWVLAKRGEKLGKSKNNSKLSPSGLIETHSADAIRYWSANAKLGADTFFSEDELGIAKRFITKLWNAARFAITLLEDFDKAQTPELMPVDRWILARLGETTRGAARLLSQYEIGQARHAIDGFFWDDLCDNYIELVKERLYEPEKHGQEARASGQYALYRALLGVLKLYAPYVPHITECIYREFFARHEQSESLHLLRWNMGGALDADILAFGGQLKEALYGMRRYKSERSLSMRADMDVLTVRAGKELMSYFRASEGDIRACSRAQKIEYAMY